MTNLRRGRDVTPRQPNIRCPRDVPYPVRMTLESLFLDPRLRLIVEPPDPDEVVASGAREALHGRR